MMRAILVLYCVFVMVKGSDIFVSLLSGAPCIEKANVAAGCSRKLREVFTPISKGPGSNRPTTSIFLFTLKNPDKAEFLHDCNGSLPHNSKFDPKLVTVVFVHGYLDGVCRTQWMRRMKDLLFMTGKYNIIFTDWTWGNFPDFAGAAANKPVVAEELAFVLKNILKKEGTSASRFHFIAHSFGAQIAGMTAKHIKPKIIGQITALDSGFVPKDTPRSMRLIKTDAEIVDIIWTNSGDCLLYAFGDDKPSGHFEFYVNGGKIQYNCFQDAFMHFLNGDIFYGLLAMIVPQLCSHATAISYYMESIKPENCEFVGLECRSYEDFKAEKCGHCNRNGTNCAVMGMHLREYLACNRRNRNPTRRRTYFLDTNFFCPYCKKTDKHLNGFPNEHRVENQC